MMAEHTMEEMSKVRWRKASVRKNSSVKHKGIQAKTCNRVLLEN